MCHHHSHHWLWFPAEHLVIQGTFRENLLYAHPWSPDAAGNKIDTGSGLRPWTLQWGKQTRDRQENTMGVSRWKGLWRKTKWGKEGRLLFQTGWSCCYYIVQLVSMFNWSSRNQAQHRESTKFTLNGEMATEGHSYQTIHLLERPVKPHASWQVHADKIQGLPTTQPTSSAFCPHPVQRTTLPQLCHFILCVTLFFQRIPPPPGSTYRGEPPSSAIQPLLLSFLWTIRVKFLLHKRIKFPLLQSSLQKAGCILTKSGGMMGWVWLDCMQAFWHRWNSHGEARRGGARCGEAS